MAIETETEADDRRREVPSARGGARNATAQLAKSDREKTTTLLGMKVTSKETVMRVTRIMKKKEVMVMRMSRVMAKKSRPLLKEGATRNQAV